MRTRCFPRSGRLTKPNEYREVFKSSSRSADGKLLVLARRNDCGCARLGLAVSKKHVRSAVKRNRLKRLIRESFRQHQYNLAGLDVIVLAQRNTGTFENRFIFKSLAGHWEKLEKCAK